MTKLNDFEERWTLRPVVAPTHDDIATARRMTMVSEVATFELEFDSNALPLSGVDLAFCLAIRKPSLNGLDEVPEFASDHAEEEHDAVFVDRLVTKPSEVDRIPVCWSIIEFVIPALVAGSWYKAASVRLRG